ncbi:uncharacterized protein [Macrobrachium rosenbergii]|uniref:uncharacterized protein n=1 Tax=Macrobrachium rosenbergii TaxID=79674 RepID=UPI0034D53B72
MYAVSCVRTFYTRRCCEEISKSDKIYSVRLVNKSPADHHERLGSQLHVRPVEHPHRQFGIKDNTHGGHNSEANGIIERLHRLLKASLTAGCQGRRWRKELPWVLLDLRTTLHAALNTSPAEALYGQALTLPADVFQDQTSPTFPSDTRKAVERKMPATTTYHGTREVYVPSELQNAKFAFIRVDAHRAPLSPAYLGPYCII